MVLSVTLIFLTHWGKQTSVSKTKTHKQREEKRDAIEFQEHLTW